MQTRRDVSSSVSASILETLESVAWPVRPDWAGFGLEERRLRDKRGWLTWSEYQRFLQALAGPGANADAHAKLGAVIMAKSASTNMRHFGRLMDGASALFRAVYGGVLRSQFPAVRSEVAVVAPRRIRVRLDIDPSLGSGEPFFYNCLGTMQRLPSLVGSPDAIVDAQVGPHGATYDVVLQPSNSLFTRMGRAWRVLRGVEADEATDELMRRVDDALTNLRDVNGRLAHAEERWRLLAAGVPGLVAVLEGDGAIVEVHGSSPRPAGIHVGGQWANGFVADDRAAVIEQIAQARTASAAAPLELRTVGGSGAVAWWTCRVGPLAGHPQRLVAVAVDVTERRRVEDALRETERRFLHAQKLEAIGRLSGGLAHDINNVLTAVQAHAEMLGIALGDREDASGSLVGIRDAVGRASALTRRLLAAGKARSGGPQTADLSVVSRDARSLLRRIIGEDVSVETEITSEALPVGMDESRLEQILLNLAVNARDALPQGGHVRIAVSQEEGCAVLSVRDDGVGMTGDVLAQATEAFFTTKPVGLGSGLGLTTVRDLVREAGGALELQSEPGRGTTVTVRLPIVAALPAVPKAPPRHSWRRGRGELVLLVEDQGEVREMVAQMLEVIGYRVRSCSGGEAAVQLAEADPGSFDLLLSDVVMPGMSGRQVARAVRALRPDVPVLLVSGFNEEEPGDLGGTGGTGFLGKPFSLGDLAAAVERLLPARAPAEK
jgi:two-component system cell cycle sensor histidine kinase/response regulator CckA